MSRTIVITGGTSGIGLALKNLFEKNGDRVLTFSLEDIENENHYVGSVSHEIKVKQVFNDIHEKYGTIDMLINCAGFGMSSITEITPIENIRNLFDVNFYGTLYCTRCALQYMNEGAKVINLASAMALFPVPFRSIYGSSKAAVLNLSFGLRMELAPAGIDVVAICPGDTKTNFTSNRVKNFETTERYGDRLKTATEHSDSKEEKRMTAEFVAEKIFKCINKPKTKPFYIIGGKYKFLYFMTRLTPKSLLLKCTQKMLGGKMVENPPKKTKPVKEKKQKLQNVELNTNDQVLEQNDENIEVQNNSTTVETQNTAAANVQEQSTTTETTAKENISNILSKITIKNKPVEEKQETTTEQNKEVNSDNQNSQQTPPQDNPAPAQSEQTSTKTKEQAQTSAPVEEKQETQPATESNASKEKEEIISKVSFDNE